MKFNWILPALLYTSLAISGILLLNDEAQAQSYDEAPTPRYYSHDYRLNWRREIPIPATLEDCYLDFSLILSLCLLRAVTEREEMSCRIEAIGKFRGCAGSFNDGDHCFIAVKIHEQECIVRGGDPQTCAEEAESLLEDCRSLSSPNGPS